MQKAFDVHKYGGCVLCAVCGSELRIITSKDKKLIRKHNLQAGIYCAFSPKHIYQIFILAEPFEKFKQRFGCNEEDP